VTRLAVTRLAVTRLAVTRLAVTRLAVTRLAVTRLALGMRPFRSTLAARVVRGLDPKAFHVYERRLP
jgi:hypothetical protein